ncbi:MULTISPECIES: DUF305 domain-containing protein [unclassified Corynebacterium]|uniref:DUF305 domain-containing protein n=1 Tax=unclassified Corynebacterium TaxID=2624378 RepID=UPI0021AAE06E|nr:MULTISPECIES: DUF305 domain-containing protein [unclassified Corynebacterium]MCT1451970.1 DUF305 domain-containing protein [Corynebacterium sp. p3-SID1145]MCT1461055.1 DUF305 domain-containing protein [Corynebacterium sp. p3-SID1140]MDN8594975.1 DUF305 domain-containing protein [Corynebacterium sp. P4_F2]WKK54765.1 DUF305 domain-containing protein [Corynebacterium sp. P4-C1]WKK64142.1 DUF305 domain-containing protein [Corynebacterium sp. P8-C1]
MADRELNNGLDVRDAETDELTRPNRKPWIIALAVIAALVLLIAALGPTLRGAFSGGGDEAEGAHNEVDVHFIGMMVPHHQQAIDMSDVLLESDVDDEQVRDLAQRIKDGQERENEQMRAWADEWGIQDDMEMHSTHIANGMFQPEELEEFATLEGDELRTTFLEMMHYHHEHVIPMTQDQIDNGGYAPLREMAQEMVDVQTAEMKEMEELLK